MKRVRSWAALYLTGAAVGSLLLCRSAFLCFGPTLLLNLTPSLPKGVYKLEPVTDIKKGEIVAFRPPARVYRALGTRAWLNEEKLFIKPIGATTGDTVCNKGNVLLVNQDRELLVSHSDSQGQKLPRLEGCRTVGSREFLPISTHSPRSFDGRYFGPIPTSGIVGKATPLFTW